VGEPRRRMDCNRICPVKLQIQPSHQSPKTELGWMGLGGAETYGTTIIICSSVSLLSSGVGLFRSFQVFLQIARPESVSSSFMVRILGKSICW